MNVWALRSGKRQAGPSGGAVPGGADCRGAAAGRGMRLPGEAGARRTVHRRGPDETAKAVSPRGTPAGVQLRWLIAAAADLPISGAQVRAHFDAAFLAQASPASPVIRTWGAVVVRSSGTVSWVDVEQVEEA